MTLGDLFSKRFPLQGYDGEVITVNTDKYTMSVLLDEGRVIEDVRWLSPSGHVDGTGAHSMPAVKDRIFVVEYRPGDFVCLGSIPVEDSRTKKFKNLRKSLNQKDYCTSVSDEAYILLQSPDFITISTSNNCIVKMDGSSNAVLIRSQRYQIHADGGFFYWVSDKDTNSTYAKILFRDKAAPDANVVVFKIGYHSVTDVDAKAVGIDKSVFSFIVSNVTQSGNDTYQQTPVFKFIVGEKGKIYMTGLSINEIYRDYIDRFAETTIKDVAKNSISTQSLLSGIYREAKTEIIDKAPYINHTEP